MNLLNKADFGRRIAQLRKRKAFASQTALAKRLGVMPATVSAWEKGKVYPDIQSVDKMATLFDLSMDDLTRKPVERQDDNSEEQTFLNGLSSVVIDVFKPVVTALDERRRREVLDHFARQTQWAVRFYSGASAVNEQHKEISIETRTMPEQRDELPQSSPERRRAARKPGQGGADSSAVRAT